MENLRRRKNIRDGTRYTRMICELILSICGTQIRFLIELYIQYSSVQERKVFFGPI